MLLRKGESEIQQETPKPSSLREAGKPGHSDRKVSLAGKGRWGKYENITASWSVKSSPAGAALTQGNCCWVPSPAKLGELQRTLRQPHSTCKGLWWVHSDNFYARLEDE